MKNTLKKINSFFNDKLSKLKNFIKQKYNKLKNIIKSKIDIIKNFFIYISEKLHLKQLYHFTKLDTIDKNVLKKTITLIFIPIIIFLYSQLFCNGKLFFEYKRIELNFIFIYFIIAFFYCIFGKIKISLYLSMLLTFIAGIVNHFITAFRGTPLVPWDIFSFNVALTVLPTFKFVLSKKAILGILLFLFGIFLLHKIQFTSFKNGKLKIAYRLIVLFVTISFTTNFYLTDMITKFELDENWDPKEEYHNNGLIASLFKQSRNLIINAPERL